MKTNLANILIIGSGVAGGVIAEGLLRKGIKSIIMIEAGTTMIMKDHRKWLDVVMSKKFPYDKLSDEKTDYESYGNQPWKIEGGRLIVRGGSTMHWGGWCPRMKPEDFELRSRIESGGLDWPLTYNQLEPYYLEAEKYLQVAGDSSDQDPPRSSSYPYEAPQFTLTDNIIIQGLDQLGISHMHIPIARNAKPINGMPACVTTGTCGYCPIEARFTGNQPLDRISVKYEEDSFKLLSNTVAKQIRVDRKNRATGVECIDTETDERFIVEAQKIIVCAGSLETPKLLLYSTSAFWPNGIGNDSNHVGRHLVANPYFYVRGKAKENPKKIQEELFMPTVGSRHWDTPEFQKEGKFFFNKAPSPDLKIANLMGKGYSRKDIEQAVIGEQILELQGTIQTFSYFENKVKLGYGTTRFGLPKTVIDTPVDAISSRQKKIILDRLNRILTTVGYTPLDNDLGSGIYQQRGDHAMCTTRMSISPSEGVVDENCKIHEMENVYIVSNAIFPSGAAANPTLTLVAIAFRFLEQFNI